MNPQDLLSFLFWFSLAALAYTFFGYPLWIAFLARAFPKAVDLGNQKTSPRISIILAAYNEEARITTRLRNLLESDYPGDSMEIIIVSDGSTDHTAEIARSLSDGRIRVIERPRTGKAACLNDGVAAAKGDIIVFGDVRQRFAPDTIRKLVAWFSHPEVGAVSGALMIEKSGSSVGGGVDAYWRLEKFIRHAEAKYDSSVGCTGAVYAIRRNVYRHLPADTLLDDVVIPMDIAAQGYRVLFDPSAVAFDPQSLEPEREKVRKQRTLAGNYQMLFRYPQWLLPWRHRLWWQLLSHKYLRLAAPGFMVLLLLSNALLAGSRFYGLLFGAQCLFYFCALVGAFCASARLAVFSIPAGFVFLNLMSVSGFRHYLAGSYRQGRWPAARS